MSQQSYANHRRWVPLYHFFLSTVILATIIGSVINLVKSLGTSGLYSASLIVAVNLVLVLIYFFERDFALRAQDRAIRAEENLRHYVLTGKLIDPKITVRQIIGARFASDQEFPALLERALKENLSEDAIKKAIKNWRADTYRV